MYKGPYSFVTSNTIVLPLQFGFQENHSVTYPLIGIAAANRNTLDAVNPRVSPLGAYLFFMLFGWGLFEGRAYLRGLLTLFDRYHINSSLPQLLFSIILQEQSKCKH